MNIKSLLLGSAAALVAVSGARAADAVVMAEPEPMEYVRICDMYGTGFFYIPGTETCLQIGGYFRVQIGGGELFDNPEDSYGTLFRFAPSFDARNETEYGTLRAFAQINFDYTNGGNDIGTLAIVPGSTRSFSSSLYNFDTGTTIDSAFIDFAGFRIGKGASQVLAFAPAGPGLGFGGVISDDILNLGASTTNYLSYNFDVAGFQATISLEEGAGDDELITYVPDVVAGLAYDGGTFRVSALAAYDANNEEFAGKVKAAVKVNESLGVWIIGAYKTNDGDNEIDKVGRNNDGTNYYGSWRGGDDDVTGGGDGYILSGGATYIFNDKVQFASQIAYDEGENFGLALDLALTPVEGLSITPELAYRDNFDEDFTPGVNDASVGGIVRIQRNF